MKNKRATAIAEIPEELLPDWRVWIVTHGGKVTIQGTIDQRRIAMSQTVRDLIDEIIEEVTMEICDSFCKYSKDCIEATESGKDYPCPLDRL